MAIIGNLLDVQRVLDNRKLDKVFEYLTEALNQESSTHRRIFSLPVGAFEKYPITDDIFALEQVFYTKPREECFFESHRNYIDFQLCLSGIEQMEFSTISTLEENVPYDEETDFVKYKLDHFASKLVLRKEDLAIFLPEDGHLGMGEFNDQSLVHKTVVKLPKKYFRR